MMPDIDKEFSKICQEWEESGYDHLCPICLSPKETQEDKTACLRSHGYTILDFDLVKPDA